LLGLPGDNTYANYAEANRTFWRQTVIPLAARTAAALSGWLGGGLVLRPDLDQLDALAPDREALWARLDGASFLSDDEKRAEAGYGPRVSGGDGVLNRKYRSDQSRDDQGRWVDEGGGDGDPGDPLLIPVAGKPGGVGPPKPPPPGTPAKPLPTRTDYGVTPRGQPFTEHGRQQATAREFTDARIDAIVENNTRTRVGKTDNLGAKTWEYSDARGNTVVTNESGSIKTVFSSTPGGKYVEKP
jgi:Phage portal protein